MDRKFVEKLIISIVIFLGVVILTAFIIGNYVAKQKAIENQNKPVTEDHITIG